MLTCARCDGLTPQPAGVCLHCDAPLAPPRRSPIARRLSILLGPAGTILLAACYGGPGMYGHSPATGPAGAQRLDEDHDGAYGLVPRVAALKDRARADGITLTPGNNLGYFGPEEQMLRSVAATDRDHWQGCQAGRFVMGIESDGAVKGCPSLQTAAYVGGNLRDRPLDAIWHHAPELAFARRRSADDL